MKTNKLLLALPILLASFSATAVTQGDMQNPAEGVMNGTQLQFTTTVERVCGIILTSGTTDAALGINDEWSGEGVSFKAYNNGGTGIDEATGIAKLFEVLLETHPFGGRDAVTLESMTIDVSGQGVVNDQFTPRDDKSYTVVMETDKQVIIQAKTSLSEHQIPAEEDYGLLTKVHIYCF
jgi:hypothetical protein